MLASFITYVIYYQLSAEGSFIFPSYLATYIIVQKYMEMPQMQVSNPYNLLKTEHHVHCNTRKKNAKWKRMEYFT